jgi:hypothetical protein
MRCQGKRTLSLGFVADFKRRVILRFPQTRHPAMINASGRLHIDLIRIKAGQWSRNYVAGGK